jgi:hypothetical protein
MHARRHYILLVIHPEHACRQNYIYVYGFTLYIDEVTFSLSPFRTDCAAERNEKKAEIMSLVM